MEIPLRPQPTADPENRASIPLIELWDSISLLIDPDTSIAVVLQMMAGVSSDRSQLFRPYPQIKDPSPDRYSYGVIGSEHQVLGLVTVQDLLPYAANPAGITPQPIRAVISPLPAFRSTDFTGIEDLITLMQAQQYRWLPVLDPHDRLLGVIALETLYLKLAYQTQAFQSRSLQLQIQQEQTFNQVTRVIRSSLDLAEIFEVSAAHIAEFLNAEVSIVHYRPDLHCWQHLVTYDPGQARLDRRDLEIPDQNNPFSDQLKQLQVVQVNDTTQIEDPINQALAQSAPGSWLLIPISYQGMIWGSLSLARRDPHHLWQAEEMGLAQRVADQLGLGIQQAQMYQHLQRELIERQKVEADLRASRELFSLAAEAIEGVIYDLNVSEWTAQRLGVFETLGYAPENTSDNGDWWIQQIHPEDRERVTQQLQVDLEQATSNHRSLEYRVRHQQGHYIHLVDYAVIIHNQQGQATRIVGHALDVTQRKQIEKQLQQQLEQTRLINHITQQIRCSLDLNLILSTAVAQIRDLFKVERVVIYRFLPDYRGEVIAESVDPQCLALLNQVIVDPCFQGKLVTAYQEGRITAIEDIEQAPINPCHRQLLASLQVRANLVVPILVDQKLWGLLIAHHCSGPHPWTPWAPEMMEHLSDQIGIAIQQSNLYSQLQTFNQELTYQVHVRNAQLQTALDLEALLRLIIEEVRDSLEEKQILETTVRELTLGLDLLGCRVNFPTAEGQAFQVVSCCPPQDPLVCPEAEEPLEQALLDSLSRSRSVLRTQLDSYATTTILSCGIWEGGELFAWLDLVRPPAQGFSQPEIRLAEQVASQCAIGIRQARLFQASQQQIKQLLELNQMKEEFVHMVSHELRTPLTNMKLSLTLLKTFELPERGTRYLEILRAECEREISLVNELLDLQAIESGRRTPTVSALELNDWLQGVVESFQGRAQERQLDLQMKRANRPITLRTDKELLGRIISELINNACKYTPPHHQIRIHLWDRNPKQQTGVQIEVENTGTEIPAEALPSLFDKFYRIPQVDRWQQGGTGLGLALVKKAVQCLGGEIRVRTGANATGFQIELLDLAPAEGESVPHSPLESGV